MNRAPNLQSFNSSETRHKPEEHRADYDYKEIAREVLARIDQRLADLERDAPRPSEARDEPRGADASDVEAGGDGMSPDDRNALVGLALRGLVGLVIVASLVGAAAYLWLHLDTAEQTVAQLSPRAVLGSTAPEDKPQPAAEPNPPAAKTAADAMAAQAAMPAQPPTPAQATPTPAAAAATAARSAADADRPGPAVSPELATLLRKMERDIAGLAQAVNELRLAQQQASQQASDDTTKSADEIKAGVNQLARSIVKAEQEEQIARPKPTAAPARTAAPAPSPKNRRATPMYYSPRDAQAEFLR